MIQTKEDLYYYLREDAKQCRKPLKRNFKQRIVDWLFPDNNFNFQVCLRKLEYYSNIGGGVKVLLYD